MIGEGILIYAFFFKTVVDFTEKNPRIIPIKSPFQINVDTVIPHCAVWSNNVVWMMGVVYKQGKGINVSTIAFKMFFDVCSGSVGSVHVY